MAAFVAAATFVTTFVAAAFFALVAVTFVVSTATLAMIARRFVLVEAGAATSVSTIAAAGQSQRAAGAGHEKSDREKCCQTLPHEESFCCWLRLVATSCLAVTGFVPVALATVAVFAMTAFALAFTATAAFAAFPAFTAVAAAFAATAAFAFAFFTGRFVLVECCAPRPVAAATSGQSQRAAGAEHEQPGREKGRKALP